MASRGKPRRVRRKPSGRHHHGDLRRALVDATIRIIERDGREAVTFRRLAKDLGVSHAAPAHHFADKAALECAVAAEGFRRFAEALEKAERGGATTVARLHAVGRAYLDFALGHAAYYDLMFSTGTEVIGPAAEALQQASERAYAVLTRCTEGDARWSGTIGANALGAWSLVHGMALLWIAGPAQHIFTGARGRATFLLTAHAALDVLVPLLVRA